LCWSSLVFIRLLKNAHLHKREARSCGKLYRKNDQTFYSGAAQGFILLRISGALHLDIFDQLYKQLLFQQTADSHRRTSKMPGNIFNAMTRYLPREISNQAPTISPTGFFRAL
jgi:hypothetical protein